MATLPSRLRPAALLGLPLAAILACSSEESGRADYFTFIEYPTGQPIPYTVYYVPWADRTSYAVDPPCFEFEFDLRGHARRGTGSGGVTDADEQADNTYARYRGMEDGTIGECGGILSFEASFTFEGVRHNLSGEVVRPFRNPNGLTISDDSAYAFGVAGEGIPGFEFWPYEKATSTAASPSLPTEVGIR